MEACIDDFKAVVPQGTGDGLGSSVMTI